MGVSIRAKRARLRAERSGRPSTMPRVRSSNPFTARRAAWVLAVLALPFAFFGASRAAAPPGPRTLTAMLSAPAVSYGATVAVTGRLTASGQGIAGASLLLQADSYPYRGFVPIDTATSLPDGTFAFTGVRPNRDTQLRVASMGAGAVNSAASLLVVEPVVSVSSQAIGSGAVALRLTAEHTALGAGSPSRAHWDLAPPGGAAFRLRAVTQTVESAHLTTAVAVVNPPAAAFVFRVCFVPAWRRAMGTSASYRRCVTADGLAAQAHGSGVPAPAFPSAGAVAAAARFLNGRAGQTAFAVVDDTGAVSGVRIHERF